MRVRKLDLDSDDEEERSRIIPRKRAKYSVKENATTEETLNTNNYSNDNYHNNNYQIENFNSKIDQTLALDNNYQTINNNIPMKDLNQVLETADSDDEYGHSDNNNNYLIDTNNGAYIDDTNNEIINVVNGKVEIIYVDDILNEMRKLPLEVYNEIYQELINYYEQNLNNMLVDEDVNVPNYDVNPDNNYVDYNYYDPNSVVQNDYNEYSVEVNDAGSAIQDAWAPDYQTQFINDQFAQFPAIEQYDYEIELCNEYVINAEGNEAYPVMSFDGNSQSIFEVNANLPDINETNFSYEFPDITNSILSNNPYIQFRP